MESSGRQDNSVSNNPTARVMMVMVEEKGDQCSELSGEARLRFSVDLKGRYTPATKAANIAMSTSQGVSLVIVGGRATPISRASRAAAARMIAGNNMVKVSVK